MGIDLVIYALEQLGFKVNTLTAWIILVVGLLLIFGAGIGGFIAIKRQIRIWIKKHNRKILSKNLESSQLEITLYEVHLDVKDSNTTQVFISLMFKTPTRINLGKLDLIFENKAYHAKELPNMIQGTESHRIEYIIPKFRPEISMPYLLREDVGEEVNPAHLSILAGSIIGDTKPFPIWTTQAWLESHKGGYQIL